MSLDVKFCQGGWRGEGGLSHRLSITRKDIKWYGKRWRLIALVRVVCLVQVRRYYCESCQVCGRRYVHWVAPTWLYIKAKGNSSGCFCPNCFDTLCRDKGITVLWTVEPYTSEAVGRVFNQEIAPVESAPVVQPEELKEKEA
jgi:hypothetical protein